MPSSLQLATRTNPPYHSSSGAPYTPNRTVEPIALLNERCIFKPTRSDPPGSPSPLLDLGSPSLDPFAFAPDRYVEVDMLHSFGVCQECTCAHPSRVGPVHWQQSQHRNQEFGNAFCLLFAEVVLFPQHVRQCPVPQAVNISEFSLARKYFLRPLAVHEKLTRKDAEELNYLCNMVIVLSILGTRLRVKEVVSGNQFEDLCLSLYHRFRKE